jgi:predicted transcriptional regulator
MTQRSLASDAGCTQSNLAKIERGKVVPSYALAGRIFQVLDAAERRGEKTVGDVMCTRVTSFDSSDTVADAAKAAKDMGVSQFPILRRGHPVGSITTKQMLGVDPDVQLGRVMEPALPSVPLTTPIVAVRELLRVAPAVIVLENGEIRGIVSPQDLI